MATTEIRLQERLAPAEASQLAMTWRRFRRHRLGLIGMVSLIVIVLSCIFVPVIMQSATGLTYEYIDNDALQAVTMANGNVNYSKPLLWTNSLKYIGNQIRKLKYIKT
jgi:ABC-type antimicrobial peptide transport system permease subunit